MCYNVFVHSTKKVSSRLSLTLFDITREVSTFVHSKIMHNLSGHSLQFIVIFIIKTSVLLSRVLGKSGTFIKWGYKALHCVHAVLVPVFQLKHHRPIHKKCNFFLAPDFINSMIPPTMVSMDRKWPLKMCIRKFCMRYILINNFD